ncbi:hypothetical protein SNE25_21230 [Mucilaginibacter sabulilitoris]|uniref:Uncharacterized protein n=1 Tax=Mucilaginibacter sabulilitoris TaxID=1173583 RepID=A0ABZ0TF91_9SPHI|nr:hypothetical protein [Mucilaginibacter sabulilitoris]WPU91844.1 hypothetical protein SNE25_21230 [Mucilaginibacter sabulilitoris]
MLSSKEMFTDFQEADYYASEVYQLKKHLTMPAAPIKQQVAKPKGNGNTKVQN